MLDFLVVCLKTVVLTYVTLVVIRVAWTSWAAYRFAPRGKRWYRFGKALPRALWARGRERRHLDSFPAESTRLMAPALAIPFGERRVDVRDVCEPRLVSPRAEPLYVSDIDRDGSVLLVGSESPDFADRVILHRADGSRSVVVAPAEIPRGTIKHASVDDGAVAWTVVDAAAGYFAVFRTEPGSPAELLYESSIPRGRDHTAYSAALIMGDRVVVAEPAGERWTLRVIDATGDTVGLGTLRFPLLRRDPIAARQGVRLVSVSLDIPGVITTQDTAIVNVEPWPPTVAVVKRGAQLGATTSRGEVVGFWRDRNALSLPSNVELVFGEGEVPGDPVCTGPWVLFSLFSASAPHQTVPTAAFAHHLASGTDVMLAQTTAGRVLERGNVVAWSEVAPAMPDPRMVLHHQDAWVATLPDELP